MNEQSYLRQFGKIDPSDLDRMRESAESLIRCYSSLQVNGAHLLSELMEGGPPIQWEHYPTDDVVDHRHGYQFFYHSHSPMDRDASLEHGHFHLFARLERHADAIDQAREDQFLASLDATPATDANTVSLLCISVDAFGVPTSLFTVNRWVTGGHLLSAEATLKLLRNFAIDAERHRTVSGWINAMLVLFQPQVQQLLIQRDETLRVLATRQKPSLLEDESAEILSSIDINIDRQIACLD